MAIPDRPTTMRGTAPKRNQRRVQARPRAPRPVAPAPATPLASLVRGLTGGARRNVRVNRRRGAAAPVAAAAIEQAPAPSPRLGVWMRRGGSLLGRFAVAIGLAYGLLAGAQALAAYVTTAPRFEAQHIVYSPTPHLPPERVAALMAIEPGTNILALDLAELESRIAADRWVREVAVRRELPDSLRIDLVEHVPAAVVLAGEFFLVDGEGRPFKRLDAGERGELPVLTGIPATSLVREGGSPEARRAIEAFHAWQQGGRPRLGEIHVGEAGEVTFFTAEGRTELRLGRGPVDARIGRYDALRAALGERADGLAVVHLDSDPAPGQRERVVASFRAPEDEEAVLEQEAAPAAAPSAGKGKGGKGRGGKGSSAPAGDGKRKKKKRIPRYE